MGVSDGNENKNIWLGTDLSDHRNHLFAAPKQVGTSLPTKADLRQQYPPVYNQGQFGSHHSILSRNGS